MPRTLNSYARMPYQGLRPVERNIAGHLPAVQTTGRPASHKVVGVLAAAAVASVLTGVGVTASAPASVAHSGAVVADSISLPSLSLPAAKPASYLLSASVTAAKTQSAPAVAHAATVASRKAAVAKKAVAAKPAGATVVTSRDRHAVTAMSGSLARLRSCESGGDYQVASGNGYYGAYQFDLSTWDSLGLHGLPSNASRQLQDVAVTRLEARKGWGPWPVCSYVAGLR